MLEKPIRAIFLPPGSTRLQQRTYFWAIASGLAYSGSSFLMTMVVNRILGGYMGGIFTLAVTIGNQLVTIGYFNMRTYQVSDIKPVYQFREYFTSRVLTTAAMAACGIIWCVAGGYNRTQTAAILLFLVFRITETFADVLEGLYQQKQRYDTACKAVFYETVVFLAAFFLALFITRDLLISLAAMAVTYVLSVILIDGRLLHMFLREKLRLDFHAQKSLLLECLPLFVTSFLIMYMTNVSKYRVFDTWGEEKTAQYGAIFMMAFVIQLFAGFVLKPMITSLSVRYHQGDKKGFRSVLIRQSLLIVLLTFICEGGAYLLGIPVLSALNGLDLSDCRPALLILLIGGGFSALYQVYQYGIIIMRHQYASLAGCAVAAVFAYLITPHLVTADGLTGAAVSYALAMAVLSAVYFIQLLYYSLNTKEKNGSKGSPK